MVQSVPKDFDPALLFPTTGMPDADWWHALWPDPLATVQALGIRPGMRVVDLCCGDGYFTAAIARQVGAGGQVLGVDLDATLLQQAQGACAQVTHQPRFTWLQADVRDLTRLLHDRFDLVLMANTFHGVPDPTDLAREVATVLKLGGRFVVVNWHPISREQTPVLGQARGPRTDIRMSPEQARAVIEPAGFELETLVELPPYHYGAVFKA